MTQIKTIVGDATNPKVRPNKWVIIPHVCNDLGKWGAGFVNAITNKFGEVPCDAYQAWYAGDTGKLNALEDEFGVSITASPWRFELGTAQFVYLPRSVGSICIANMVAQHGVKRKDDAPDARPPIRYGALVNAMRDVANVAKNIDAEIHCPKFGSDLAGGNWTEIEKIIEEIWCDEGISVTVYEFVPQTA